MEWVWFGGKAAAVLILFFRASHLLRMSLAERPEEEAERVLNKTTWGSSSQRASSFVAAVIVVWAMVSVLR